MRCYRSRARAVPLPLDGGGPAGLLRGDRLAADRQPRAQGRLRQVEAVELGRVSADEAAHHVGLEVPHRLADRLDRVRPDRIGMRIIARPEQVLGPPELEQPHGGRALLEGAIYLALEDFARLHLVRNTALVVPVVGTFQQTPVAIVELLDDPWYPAHAALGDDDLE